MTLNGTITPGRRLRLQDRSGARLQQHPPLRQHGLRHVRLRADLPRRPHLRLRLQHADVVRTGTAVGPSRTRTSPGTTRDPERPGLHRAQRARPARIPTRTVGFWSPIPSTTVAPGGDGEDFFNVDQLQTMAVAFGLHADPRRPGGHGHLHRQHDRQPGLRRQSRPRATTTWSTPSAPARPTDGVDNLIVDGVEQRPERR